jgi:hypothetical protein
MTPSLDSYLNPVERIRPTRSLENADRFGEPWIAIDNRNRSIMNQVIHFSTERIFGLTILLCLSGTADLRGADVSKLPPPADQANVTFKGQIKPLFARSCTKCHGEEKQKAKLRLDSREAVLQGAKGEPVIRPGDSATSKLVLLVSKATDDDTEWMPPPGKAQELSSEEIGLVRAWIDQGAK